MFDHSTKAFKYKILYYNNLVFALAFYKSENKHFQGVKNSRGTPYCRILALPKILRCFNCTNSLSIKYNNLRNVIPGPWRSSLFHPEYPAGEDGEVFISSRSFEAEEENQENNSDQTRDYWALLRFWWADHLVVCIFTFVHCTCNIFTYMYLSIPCFQALANIFGHFCNPPPPVISPNTRIQENLLTHKLNSRPLKCFCKYQT